MTERDPIEYQDDSDLIWKQGQLLQGVVNALRGAPKPWVRWSSHDAAELAQEAARALQEIRDAATKHADTGEGDMPAALVLAILDRHAPVNDDIPMPETWDGPGA